MEKIIRDFTDALGIKTYDLGRDVVSKVESAETRRIIAVTSRSSFNLQVDSENKEDVVESIHKAVEQLCPRIPRKAIDTIKNFLFEKVQHSIWLSDFDSSKVTFNMVVATCNFVETRWLFGLRTSNIEQVSVQYFTIVTSKALIDWALKQK